MAKIKKEFYCNECRKYFDIKLNISLDGNYRVHCPNCGHIHYRTVKKGVITDQRFPDNHESILIEDIYPMKSSCRDLQKEVDGRPMTDAQIIKSLWADRFSVHA